MKDKAIKFLASLPESKTEQFNQALELYRKSPNNNPQQVRYMNSLGFSADRLQVLLYELKKLHNITDLQLAEIRGKKVVKMKAKKDENEFLESGGLMINVTGLSEEDKEEVATILAKFAEGASPEVLEALKIENEDESEFQQAQLSEFAAAITEYSGNAPEGEDRQSLIHFILDEIVKAALHDPTEEELEARREAFSKMKLFPSEENKDASTPLDETDDSEGPKEGPEKGPETDDISTQLEVTDGKDDADVSTPLDGTKEAEPVVGPSEEFKEKLAAYEVEDHSYNENKSFAADVSDVTGEHPADQKHETLKAFIQEAKKKFQAA